jgi:hypothetical protein
MKLNGYAEPTGAEAFGAEMSARDDCSARTDRILAQAAPLAAIGYFLNQATQFWAPELRLNYFGRFWPLLVNYPCEPTKGLDG